MATCRLLLGAALGWIGCIVVNDSAMGGQTQSAIDTTAESPNILHWAGILVPSSTGLSGSFASFHCPLGPERVERLGNAGKFVFKVSGGWGKSFLLRAGVDGPYSFYSRPFATALNGSSVTVAVHIDEMEPRLHGQWVPGVQSLLAKDVVSLGFVITAPEYVGPGAVAPLTSGLEFDTADAPNADSRSQHGPFTIDVEWVAAVDGNRSSPGSPPRASAPLRKNKI